MNTFGTVFRVTTFGESHGPAMGCVIDGCPAGVPLDTSKLTSQLKRRRPGQSAITSPRDEPDVPEILSGVHERKTLGTPIAIIVRNKDVKSEDYEEIISKPRPGHADATWKAKFGHVDYRGGGRASGRETVARVMAGWVAEELLAQLAPDLRIVAWVSQVGEISMPEDEDLHPWTREEVDSHPSRCPDAETASSIEKTLLKAKEEGESFGGIITARVSGVPAGLGEPVFLKLNSYLASALSSIGTVCGLWWHQRPISLPGTEFHAPGNTYGGISGGISNGEDLLWHIACKPVSTLGEVAKAGRHDPCILPRAVPIVESMVAIVLADLYLIDKTRRVDK